MAIFQFYYHFAVFADGQRIWNPFDDEQSRFASLSIILELKRSRKMKNELIKFGSVVDEPHNTHFVQAFHFEKRFVGCWANFPVVAICICICIRIAFVYFVHFVGIDVFKCVVHSPLK